jgi:hypothetical protein
MKISAQRSRRFLLTVLAPVAVAMLCAVTANAYVDPYWFMAVFGERSGIRYCVEDERQNKINKMIFGGAKSDSVLIGSSRSAFFDTTYFTARVFNLAVNGLRPVEYPEYLRMYVKYVGIPRDVYLGLDFFGYILESNDNIWIEHARTKENAANATGYRFNTLLDLGVLKISVFTVTACTWRNWYSSPTHRYDGVRSVRVIPRDPALLESQLKFFAGLYDMKTPTDGRYREYLERLKQVSPGSRFHAYIPPLSADLFHLLISTGRAEDYKRWLAILADEFGSVVQFSGINSFTIDPGNFYDTHHVFAERTRKMIEIMDGKRDPDADGFGRLISKENVAHETLD